MVTKLQNKINNYIEFKDKLMKFGLYYLDEYYKYSKKKNKLINYLEDVNIILDNNYNHVISISYTVKCPSYNNMTAQRQMRININEFEKWYEENS
jgi:hypothetical protein